MAHFRAIKLFSCITLIVMSSFMPLCAYAYNNNHFYSSNDILFYDSDAKGCANSSSGVGSTGSISLEKSPELQNIFQLLLNGGMNAGQAAAIMGNMYQESKFNSGSEESNGMGYGLAQWSLGRRVALEAFAAKKNVDVSDVPMQIEYLFQEYNTTYSSKLSEGGFDGTDIAKSTEIWMDIFEAPYDDGSSDPAGLASVRIPAAQKVYDFYKDLSPDSSVASSGCNNIGNSAVAGDIVSTAKNFALPKPVTNGTTSLSDASPAYQAAMKQFNPSIDVTDCGGFIATVMIASGADTKYPLVNVDEQHKYVKSHPEKYLIIENPTESDLQPGDILISTGHTTMYTGGTGYTDVDASLGDRVPSVRDSGTHVAMIRDGAIIARIIE